MLLYRFRRITEVSGDILDPASLIVHLRGTGPPQNMRPGDFVRKVSLSVQSPDVGIVIRGVCRPPLPIYEGNDSERIRAYAVSLPIFSLSMMSLAVKTNDLLFILRSPFCICANLYGLCLNCSIANFVMQATNLSN